MGTALNGVIILLVLLRSLPYAAIKAPVHAILTPNIDAGQRATFHSMMSLVARLSFFLTLFVLSQIVDESELSNWVNLSDLLQYCFGGGMILLICLWVFSKGQFSDETFQE